MKEVKWSYRIFGIYIQMSTENKLSILYKKEGQWIDLLKHLKKGEDEKT